MRPHVRVCSTPVYCSTLSPGISRSPAAVDSNGEDEAVPPLRGAPLSGGSCCCCYRNESVDHGDLVWRRRLGFAASAKLRDGRRSLGRGFLLLGATHAAPSCDQPSVEG